ncbi:MAG: ribonuclease P protein component [Bacilli bacterium]|nr:ribonuclease P protein component [Bacilli bacterium]
MKKINTLKANVDFNRIISENKPFKYKGYILYLERCDTDYYHFGLSVGKKIGNAVVRNKYKRRLRNIIDKKSYQNNFNCIIIVTKGILDKSFKQMEDDLLKAFEILKITKEN